MEDPPIAGWFIMENPITVDVFPCVDGFSIINHPFGGTPMYGNPHIFKRLNVSGLMAIHGCSTCPKCRLEWCENAEQSRHRPQAMPCCPWVNWEVVLIGIINGLFWGIGLKIDIPCTLISDHFRCWNTDWLEFFREFYWYLRSIFEMISSWYPHDILHFISVSMDGWKGKHIGFSLSLEHW